MCIRDSTGTVRKAIEIVSLSILSMTWCDRVHTWRLRQGLRVEFGDRQTVSYTHLDVYKRQDSAWPPATPSRWDLQQESRPVHHASPSGHRWPAISSSAVQSGKARVAAIVENSSARCKQAVSYTHLDVYKRQGDRETAFS